MVASYATGISLPDMVGILCGATTNTPALGAAQQTLKQMGMDSSTPALGCAVAYPMGVVGVILAVLLIRKVLVRKEDLEIKEKDDANKTYIAAFQVHNPAIFNKSIKDIAHLSYPKFVISRLWRDGHVSIPTSDKVKDSTRHFMRSSVVETVPSVMTLGFPKMVKLPSYFSPGSNFNSINGLEKLKECTSLLKFPSSIRSTTSLTPLIPPVKCVSAYT